MTHGIEFLKEKHPETVEAIELLAPVVPSVHNDDRISYRKTVATIFLGGSKRIRICRKRGNNDRS